MTTGNAQRRAARVRVANYHESCLTELVDRLAVELDAYRATSIDVHDADRAIHQYHHSAGQLWRFCFGARSDVEFAVQLLDTQTQPIGWWARGAARKGH